MFARSVRGNEDQSICSCLVLLSYLCHRLSRSCFYPTGEPTMRICFTTLETFDPTETVSVPIPDLHVIKPLRTVTHYCRPDDP